MEHLDGGRWRKCSYSANGGTDCVEVGLDRGAEGVMVRDTRARSALSCGSARGPGAPSPAG